MAAGTTASILASEVTEAASGHWTFGVLVPWSTLVASYSRLSLAPQTRAPKSPPNLA